MADVEVMEVIRTELLRRGDGVGDPVRIITQYWLRTGELLVEFDPETEIADREHRQQLARDAVNADTTAARLAWQLALHARLAQHGQRVDATVTVDREGHPYAVNGTGRDENEALCRLRDALVELFDATPALSRKRRRAPEPRKGPS